MNLKLMKWWSYFGFLHFFLFYFVHMYWRNIPPLIIRGIEPDQVVLPWRWSQYVLLKYQNKSKHYMSNRWPSFDQQWWKKLTDFKLNVHTQNTENLNAVCRDYHALWSTLYLCFASRASYLLHKSSVSCLFVPGTKVCMYSCV